MFFFCLTDFLIWSLHIYFSLRDPTFCVSILVLDACSIADLDAGLVIQNDLCEADGRSAKCMCTVLSGSRW